MCASINVLRTSETEALGRLFKTCNAGFSRIIKAGLGRLTTCRRESGFCKWLDMLARKTGGAKEIVIKTQASCCKKRIWDAWRGIRHRRMPRMLKPHPVILRASVTEIARNHQKPLIRAALGAGKRKGCAVKRAVQCAKVLLVTAEM